MTAKIIELTDPHNVVEDTQGDHIMVTQIIKATSQREARAWADAMYPTSRCTHSYDCCGHYYQHYRPTVRQISKAYGTYIVVADLYHNV